MNILFISNDPNIFKEESAVRARMRAYAEVVAEKGGELHILSRAPKTVEVTDGPLILHGVKMRKLFSPLILSRFARQIILASNISVVSAQDPFEHGWAAAKAVEGTNAKLHVQVHTDFLSPWFTKDRIKRSPHVRMPVLNTVRVRIAEEVLRKADGIRVVSERIRDSIIEHFGEEVSAPSVIPINVSTKPHEAVPLPPRSFTFALIAVGRLEPEKRIQDIIAAVAYLKDRYPSLGAFIVGGGRERKKLQKMVQKLGVTDRIIFLGPRADARGLMQSAQAFIQTSAYEGYGLTLIEAALSRVPIITSDVGVVGEVFRGYEHVLAAPVGDPTNFAAHIAWLIEDQHARKELIGSAEQRALEHLSQVDSSPRAIIEDILRLV